MTDGSQDSPDQPGEDERSDDRPTVEWLPDDSPLDGNEEVKETPDEIKRRAVSSPSNLTTGILHQFVEGKDDALAHLVRLQENQLLSYIDRKLPTHVRGLKGIEDIFQEMVITLARKRDHGELEVINTPAFLGLVKKIIDGLISHAVEAAHRKKRDVRRKQSPVKNSVLSSIGGDQIDRLAAKVESPSLPAHRSEQVAAVRRCLARMSEHDVEIWFLVMNCEDKEKYESIGKKLNITAGAAAKRFERARNTLQALLRGEYPDSI